jgi:hypothetical protein
MRRRAEKRLEVRILSVRIGGKLTMGSGILDDEGAPGL